MQVDPYLSAGFRTGSITVGTSSIPLFPDKGHNLEQGIQLIAASTNSGIIYLSANTTASINDYPLIAKDSIFLRIMDTSAINLISDTPGQKLHFLYM